MGDDLVKRLRETRVKLPYADDHFPTVMPQLQLDAADEIERLRALKERLVQSASKFVFDLECLARESDGVAGLHRNGDVAPWDEVLPGGEYEDWLGSIALVKDALTAARQEPS